MTGNETRENKILLYMHAGSGNHGCEAIVNSVCHMVKKALVVLTNSEAEDRKYSLACMKEEPLCELVQERHFSKHRIAHVLYYIWRKVKKDPESFLRYRYRAAFGQKFYPLAISIGGDNYCYDTMIKDLVLSNKAFNARGTETVLLGCSIEPELFNKKEWKDMLTEDMNRYHAIIARESMTYAALKQVVPEEKLFLFPDPAFTLEKKELPLPEGFAPGNTIGINVSPMIQDNESTKGITMSSYQALLRHIIKTTDMQVALIPHVVWERNDDRKPIAELYETFKDTGRVIVIEDATCEELKGYIARCRMFIGARTHATIAAYSSCVPTLVVGYSVKAKGIAKDLFGTYDNYVIPVQQLQSVDALIDAYEWMSDYEEDMKKHLEEVMPDYVSKALKTGEEIERIWNCIVKK